MTEQTETDFSQLLKDKHVVVVGGASGIGKATAKLASSLGAAVTIASRNLDKLRLATSDIGSNTSVAPVDMTDDAAVKTWASELGEVDHLIVSASSAAHGAFADLSNKDLRAMFDAKFFGPYTVAREVLPFINDGGSISLFSGVLSRRPGIGATGLGAVNSAVEGLVRGLALELGKTVRVNGISPGMVRSEAYEKMEPAAREAMFADTGGRLPIGRVGFPDEIAQAVVLTMTNAYINGAIIDVDGGHMVRSQKN